MAPADQLVLDTWGPLVRSARDTLGLSQKAAAERIGIDQATLSRIENGQYRAMTPAMILRLCLGLSLEPESFRWPRAILEIARSRSAA